LEAPCPDRVICVEGSHCECFILKLFSHSNLFIREIFRIFGLICWAIISASWMGSQYFVGLNHREWTLCRTSVYLEIGLNFIYFKMYYDKQNYTKWPQNVRTPYRRKLRKNRVHNCVHPQQGEHNWLSFIFDQKFRFLIPLSTTILKWVAKQTHCFLIPQHFLYNIELSNILVAKKFIANDSIYRFFQTITQN
jgi:hypothetical protein